MSSSLSNNGNEGQNGGGNLQSQNWTTDGSSGIQPPGVTGYPLEKPPGDPINSSDESSDMIVPAVVYGGKVQEDEEGEDEVVFMASPNVDASDDDDGGSYSNANSGRTRNRKRKGKPSLTASPKRKAVRKSPNPKKPETPRSPPKKVKPRASLKSIVEKIKQKRLISKANVEFEVEQLEWKRRRFENSLHLFRIKQGRKANAAFLAGQQETVGSLWKFPQGHPKMRANDVIPRVPCPDCGKTSNKRFLEVHRNVMHRKIPAFVCNTCGRKCRDFENLKLHLSTHWHSRNTRARRPVLVKERRTDLCLLCGRTYKKSSLNLHLAIHGIPRRFNCKKCESRFENSRDLKDHQVVHEEGGYYAFKCDSCTQGFKIESFLIQHHLVCEMRAVDRPFRCTFCEKRFKLKHHLESHLFEVHRLSKEESRGMVYPGLAKRTVNRKRK